jgi:excisionase family DNA binding protein
MYSMPQITSEEFERLLNVAEAADFLCVSPSYVYRMVAGGMLTHVKIGGAIRFQRSDLQEFIAWQKRHHKRN